MTTINIDKLLLEQVQDLLYRVTRWKGESHEVLTDLHDIKEAVKAVLAAPASAPEPVAWMSPKRFYRTRAMALINGEQLIEPLYLYPPATAPEPVATVAEVHMSRYTLEWTNGPLPEGTKLYAAPQAQPERKPLKFNEMEQIVRAAQIAFCLDKVDSTEVAIIRAVEAHHGIVPAPEDKP